MFYKIMRVILYPFIRLFFRIKITGSENIPHNRGYILCANHVSVADVFALAVAFKCHIRYMGKEELFKNPVLGFFFRALGAFAVKRGTGDTKAIEEACEILKNGGVFGIFPEGTRSKNGEIGKMKSGAALIAAKTQADVLPVSIKYSTVKPRIFCKVQINIGKLIEYDSSKSDESLRQQLRRTTDIIGNSIQSLWEMMD